MPLDDEGVCPDGYDSTRADPQHQPDDDQPATKQTGAVCESNADRRGAVEIGFAEHLARIGYDTDTPEGCQCKGTSRREH